MDMHGNTVGSRESLSIEQAAIVIGKILGDGCLEKNGHHVRLRIEQSDKQKEYVFWLFEKLKPFVAKAPSSLFYKGRGGKSTKRWRFSTRSLQLFDQYLDVFYPSGKKKIPKNIADYLQNPLTLAIWYMDDGYLRTDQSGAYLCTSSFNEEEHKKLQNSIWKVYSIETSIHFAGKYPRLHIPSRYLQQFMQTIKPFILNCFQYKLSLTP